MQLVLFQCFMSLAVIGVLSFTLRGASQTCITNCDGMLYGNYQSCLGCNVFATCGPSGLLDNRTCPATLLWDDVKKRCDYTSSTCTASSQLVKQQDCVKSCVGRAYDNYQSCISCHVYATCGKDGFHDNRPCPGGLVWDDNKKRCEYTSSTCFDQLISVN